MRLILKKVLNYLQIPFFLFFILKIRKNTNLLVLDIDNTLADTWPFLFRFKETDFFRQLPLLHGTKKYIDVHYFGFRRVFLTHRSITKYGDTKKWLIVNNLFLKDSLLIFTQHPEDKLIYLRAVSKKKCNVIYIDDLSYNHENGEIKFYTKIISKLLELRIKHLDYFFIQKINSSELLNK